MKIKDHKSKAGNIPLKVRGKKTQAVGSKSALHKQSGTVKAVEASPRTSQVNINKQIIGAVDEGEDNYRGVFENSPIGVFQSTPEGQFVKVNQAMAHIFGFSSPEAMLASIKDIATQIHADPATRKEFERILSEQGQVSEFINKNLRMDGSIIWTSTSARAVKDKAGTIQYYEGFVTDISERKQVEEALKQSEEQYKLMFESTPVAINITRGTEIIYANPSYLKMFGFSQLDELKNIPPVELFAPEYRSKIVENIELRSKGSPVATSYEAECLHKDGTRFPVLMNLTRTTFEEGPATVGFVIDITERKQVEKALSESETQYRLLVEQSPDMVGVIADERLVYINPSGVSLLGAKRAEELLGKHSVKLMHPDDLAVLRERLQRVTRSGGTNPVFKFRLIKLDGKEIQVESASLPIIFQGKPATQFIARDITERIQAEEALQRSEAKFRAVVENSKEGILFGDANAKILYRSPSYNRINGFGDEERIGHSGFETVHPDDMEGVHRYWAGLIEHPQVSSKAEYRIRHKDGTWRWIETSGVNLLGNADVQSVVITSRDITERKQAEEELRQSREVLRQSFASLHDALFIIDAKTVKITDCNPAASEMFGYDRSEMIGQTTALLHIDNEALTEFRRRLNEAVDLMGFLYLPEYRMRKKDGTIFRTDHTVTPLLDAQGRTTGWVSVVRDITERKSKEEQLAESESRYKGLFEDSPISLWEEDFSAVKKRLDSLRAEGIKDFPGYFASHPEVVTECEGLIKVLDVNKATLRLFGANRKEDILHSLAKIFDGQPTQVFVDELVNIAEGKTKFTWEGINRTLDGRLRNIDLVWSAAPGFEDSLTKVLVSVTDITERKQANKLEDAVYRIANATVTSSSLDNLYAEIHHIISGVMHAENFYITLYDEERDLLKFPYFKDESDEPYLKDARPERGLTAYVLRTGKSLLCTQAVHDELERRGEVKLLGAPSAIWLGVPLSIQGKTIGAMVVQHYSDPEAYGEREQHMLEYVSAQVATAIRRKQAEEDVRDSEARYRALFEDSPISLWLEDFSGVKQRLDDLRLAGVTNFEDYFKAHPEVVKECAALVKNLDTNNATMTMHGAKRKEDLLKTLAETLDEVFIEGFRDELTKVAEGKTSFRREGINKTLDGRLINIDLNWSVIPGYEESLSRVLISIIDITERKRAEAERQALLEIMQGLVITDSLQEFLELMRQSLDKVLDAKNLFVVFHDKHSGMFEEVFAVDKYDISIPSSRLEKSITSYVFRTGEALLLTEERFEELVQIGEVELVGHKQASWLGTPIKTPNEIIGVIAVQNYEIPNCYSERDKEFLASVGAQVALAIERRRAEEKLENQLHWLSALRAIDSAISSSFDLRVTLDLLLTQVTTELRVDAADVLLLNRNSNELVYAAGRGFRGTGITRTRLRLGTDSSGKAVLERRTINIPNLAEATRPIAKAELVADEGFVAFYAVPLMAKGQAKGVLELFHRGTLDPDPDWLNFLETLAGETAIAIDNAQLFDELQRSNMELALAYDATIEGWSEAMDMRDRETEGHTQRVTDEAVKLARAMDLQEREVTDLRRGALLHDIGKMGLPDSILQKPEPLSDEEAILMKKHPTLAFEMLSHVRYLQPAINIPYCHHEKWDGTGYPRGLKGDQIPLSARIFAVVDVYDALVSDRPYRTAWSKEKALEYIRSESGTEFDPVAAEMFLKMKAEERTG